MSTEDSNQDGPILLKFVYKDALLTHYDELEQRLELILARFEPKLMNDMHGWVSGMQLSPHIIKVTKTRHVHNRFVSYTEVWADIVAQMDQ